MRTDLDAPHVNTDQPLCLPRTIQAQIFARYFRSAAVEFRSIMSEKFDASPPSKLIDRCGRWIIQAQDLELFPDLVELRELVSFHKMPTGDFATAGRQALRMRCPTNLFLDVSGGTMVWAKTSASADGAPLELVKDDRGRAVEHGGLVPRLSPGHLELSRVERAAHTCELLADLIEWGTVNGGKECEIIKNGDAENAESIDRNGGFAKDLAYRAYLREQAEKCVPLTVTTKDRIDDLYAEIEQFTGITFPKRAKERMNYIAKLIGIDMTAVAQMNYGDVYGELKIWFDRKRMEASILSNVPKLTVQIPEEKVHPSNTKPKRSTQKGDAVAKLIAALTEHHRYGSGGILHFDPIGNNELARHAGVDKASASAFFKAEFRGHAKYKVMCRDEAALIGALKLLNDEFAPHHLYGKVPAIEAEDKE